MKASAAEVLREAVRGQHPNDTFEKALGRAVRTHGGTFDDYVELIGRVRGRARRDKTTLPEAARALAAEA